MKYWIPFLLLPLSVMAEPLDVLAPVSPVTAFRLVEINYAPPFLWVRFSIRFGTGPVQSVCYKVDPTVPPAPTNGWTSAFDYWSTGQWVPNATPMTQADIDFCRQ